ncbi:MAG: ABC transporter substrate-binding protein [Chloroflexota bacterium]
MRLQPHVTGRAARLRLGALLAATLLTAACSSLPGMAPAVSTAAPGKLKVQLNFIRNVEHAGLLFAEKEGYYKAENLDVEIVAGGTGIDPMQVVAAGGADIGVGPSSSVINARSQSVPVKAFAAQFQKSPVATTCRVDSGVKQISDIKGKKIGVKPTARPLFNIVLTKAGLTADDLEIVPNAQTDITPLADKRIDCLFTTFAVNEPVALKQQGVEVLVLLNHDNGLPEQTNAYYTNEETLAAKSDLLVRWTRATRKGWDKALADPAATAKTVLSSGLVENLNETQQTEQSRLQTELMKSPATSEKGLLWLDAAIWDTNAKNVFEQGVAGRLVPSSEVMTTEILEKAGK